MKIYHYQRNDRQPNFGDELNQWLWPQLMPDCFGPERSKDDDAHIFIGTGTLLNSRLPQRIQAAKHVSFIGTGAGYEQPLQQIPKHWHIYCVRGPLSAQQLHLPASKAVADGGILVNRIFTNSQPKRYSTSFIPHIHHANYAADLWESVCNAANIHYIDPRWPVETVLKDIGQSQLLLAEAMHGAIVADALRVPWIPLVTSPRILSFKWQDWCQSVELTYQPQFVPPLSPYPRWGRGLRSGTAASQHWWRALQQNIANTIQHTFPARVNLTAARLNNIISTVKPNLSHSEVLSARLAQLEQHIDVFKLEHS
ncbi:MAG: polysaccharide pyruvyl transferase family protein, partial [Cyanobacteria bacterium P01_D01_bin.2]